MKRLNRSPARDGLTLIELLIVVFLIGVLATLVSIYIVPSFSDNKNVIRGVDRVTITLSIAKQRALRDQSPRGVRFLLDPHTNHVSQLQLIELPDPFTGGQVTVLPNAPTKVIFQNVDLVGAGDSADPTYSGWNAQPGDYFRFLGAGTPTNYPIASIAVNFPTTTVTLSGAGVSPLVPISLSNQYQIIRQTRPVSGEALIDLPNNVVVDLGLIHQLSQPNQIPSKLFPTLTYHEILFDIGGGVLNRGSSAPIALIIRDSTADNPLDPNTTRILAVYPRTGMIAAHPVNPIGNPVQYALDGRSSGI